MSETELLPSRSVRRLAETLRSLKIEFALVDGVAVALVSTPRLTADIDAVVLDIDDRLDWLVEALRSAGYSPRASDPIAFARRTRVLTLRDPYEVGIDLMMGLLPFDEDLVRRALQLGLDDETIVPVATPEHLIVMKAVAWRPRDQQDIREIVAANPAIDREFVFRQVSDYMDLLEVPERTDELRRLMNERT